MTPMMSALLVYAQDVSAVSHFYQAVLAGQISEQHEDYWVVIAPGVEVVVLSTPLTRALPVVHEPLPRQDVAIKPVFIVDDLQRVREAAVATGGGAKPAHAEWRFGDFLVLDGWDPEGNIIQFRQKAE